MPTFDQFAAKLRSEGLDDGLIAALAEGVEFEDSPEPQVARGGSQIPSKALEAGGAAPTASIQPEGSEGLLGAILSAVGKTGKENLLQPVAKTGQSTLSMLASAGEGIGSAIEQGSTRPGMDPLGIRGGYAALGRTIKQVSQDVGGPASVRAQQLSPKDRKSFFAGLKAKPVETLVQHGLENIGPLLTVLGTASVTGGGSAAVLVPAFLMEGGAAYDQAVTEGATEEEAIVAAGATGLVNMWLERFGAGKVLKGIRGGKAEVAQFFKRVGTSMLTEGGTESVQEFTGNLSALATYAGDRGFSASDMEQLFSPEALEQYGAAGIIGAVTGGGTTVALSPRGGLSAKEASDLPIEIPTTLQPQAELVEGETRQRQVLGASGRVRTFTERVGLVGDTKTWVPEGEVTIKPGERLVDLDPSKPGAIDAVTEAKRALQKLGETAVPVGEPALASPAGDNQQVRDFVAAQQEERLRRSPPVVRHDTEVMAEVRARLAVPGGVERESLRFLQQGATTDADNGVAKRLIQDASKRALETGNIEDLMNARALNMKYLDEGSEQARTLRFRRDFSMDPTERKRQALRDAILWPSEKLRKTLDSVSNDEQRVEAEALYAREIEQTRRDLAETGIDLDALLDETVPVTEAMEDQMLLASHLAGATKANTFDKVLEFFRASILSAPVTQMRNFGGNSFFLVNEFFLQRPVERALNKAFFKDPESAQAGEVREAVRGLVDRGSFKRAWDLARRSYVTEVGVFDEQFGGGPQKVDPIRDKHRQGAAIAGKKGRIIRTPMRMLVAADQFAQSLIYEMSLHTVADRTARARGLAGDEARAFIDDAVASPDPMTAKAAYDESLLLTFKRPLGSVGNIPIEARRKAPFLTFAMPFVMTPVNIAKISVKKSPLGILGLLHKYARQGGVYEIGKGPSGYTYKKSAQVRDWAEQVMAWGSLMMLLGLVDDTDDLPWITGSPALEKSEREAQYRGVGPQSIRLFGHSWSYAQIEPLSFPLTAAVDAAYAFKRALNGRADAEKEWGKAFATVTRLVRDKTFMRGLNDIMDLVGMSSRGAFLDAGADYATNLVTAFVPNVIRSTARAVSPTLRDVKPSGPHWAKERGQLLSHQSLPIGNAAPPRHDLWGRPIILGQPTGIPATDFAFRLLSPSRTARVKGSEVDRLIKNWNNYHPGEEWYPDLPGRTLTIRGNKVKLTRPEYQEYIQRAGTMAHEDLLGDIAQGRLNVDDPSLRDIKKVNRAIERARDRTKQLMFREGDF